MAAGQQKSPRSGQQGRSGSAAGQVSFNSGAKASRPTTGAPAAAQPKAKAGPGMRQIGHAGKMAAHNRATGAKGK